MRRIILAVLVAFFVLVTPASANHGVAKWKGRVPLTINVDVSAVSDPGILQALSAAENQWSLSSVLDVVSVPGAAKVSVVVDTFCNAGCSEVNMQGGYVKGRYTYFISSVQIHIYTSVLAYSPAEQRGVICHELGHALGLGHQTDISSCMYATTAGANVPNAHDYEQLELLYR